MNANQNYEKLNEFLARYGLTYEDIASDFTKPLGEYSSDGSRDSSGKLKKIAPMIVIPSQKKVTPEMIANGSYTKYTQTMKDWFEYDFRNETIIEHLGNPRVISSLQEDPKVEFRNQQGKLFLDGDGNHRLFNYLLLYIVEKKSAKTPEQKMAVEEKFSLVKNINYEHDSKTINQLLEFESEQNQNMPPLTKEYIDKTGKTVFGDYLEYNPDEDTYDLTINARTCKGVSSRDLLACIGSIEKEPDGLRFWKNYDAKSQKTTYYAAYFNRVIKTQDINEFKQIVSEFREYASQNPPPEYADKYLSVYDAKKQTFDVTTSYDYVKKSDKVSNVKEEFVQPYEQFINDNAEIIVHKANDRDIEFLDFEIQQSTEENFNMPRREYNDLSLEEFQMLQSVLIQEMQMREQLKKENSSQSGDSTGEKI